MINFKNMINLKIETIKVEDGLRLARLAARSFNLAGILFIFVYYRGLEHEQAVPPALPARTFYLGILVYLVIYDSG